MLKNTPQGLICGVEGVEGKTNPDGPTYHPQAAEHLSQNDEFFVTVHQGLRRRDISEGSTTVFSRIFHRQLGHLAASSRT